MFIGILVRMFSELFLNFVRIVTFFHIQTKIPIPLQSVNLVSHHFQLAVLLLLFGGTSVLIWDLAATLLFSGTPTETKRHVSERFFVPGYVQHVQCTAVGALDW